MSNQGEHWVTINGTHVLIGASGRITKGPAKWLGSKPSDLTSSSSGSSRGGSAGSSSAKSTSSRGSAKSSSTSNSKSTAKPTAKSSTSKTSTSTASKTAPKSEKITKDSRGRDTFNVDGKTYHYEVRSDGSAYITYDDSKYGGETLFGFNSPKTKGFGSAKEAINNIKETNARVNRIDALEAKAKKSGGIALWDSNRIIKPGTVERSGVDKNGKVLYSAKDINGKTISLTDGDMGILLIKGIDARNERMIASTFKKASTKTNSSKTTRTPKTTSRKSTTKASTTKKTTSRSTTKKATKGKYTADNIPQVVGASKSVMRKTASLMNQGYSYDDAFDRALESAGYGPNTRRGMFR